MVNFYSSMNFITSFEMSAISKLVLESGAGTATTVLFGLTATRITDEKSSVVFKNCLSEFIF